MTSGLDDGVPDNHCTLDTCLNYLAQPGTRWAYHNAPYTLLEQVLNTATGIAVNSYTQSRLKVKIGMTGVWTTVDYDNVFFSKLRSMARFGLLMQNNCIWNNDTLLHDAAYINQMTNTSQTLNLSYGYLWWLNGKPSYMFPGSQLVVPGSYAPAAPADMFAGLGKNGQIVSVSKSEGLVVLRMGNQAAGGDVPTALCNSIWEKLNAVMCNVTSTANQVEAKKQIKVFPNPANNNLQISLPADAPFEVQVMSASGALMQSWSNIRSIDISSLAKGLYVIIVQQAGKTYTQKFIKD
jgi:CubicO group peptidase (beta-lactamase class C family)